MKKYLLLAAMAASIVACEKDDLRPRDRKNDCKDCVVYIYYKDTGQPLDTFTYDNYLESISEPAPYCDFIDFKLESRTDAGGNPIYAKVDCR